MTALPKIDWVQCCYAHKGKVHETRDSPPRYFASTYFGGPGVDMVFGAVCATREDAARDWALKSDLAFEALAFRMTDA